MFGKVSRLYREIPFKLNKTAVPPPQTIFLVINSECNLHCCMCDVGTNQDTHFRRNMDTGQVEMPFYVIEKNLIGDIIKHRYNPMIAIISTEPLLHSKIIDVVKLIRESGLKCQLTTNGLLLPEFSNSLVDADLNILYVSIDGPREVHNQIRGNKEAWDNAMMGMYLVADAKEKIKKKTPLVRVNYTISGYNYGSLLDFLKSRWFPPEEDEFPFEVTRFFGHVDFSHLNVVTEEMAKSHNSLYPTLPCTASSVINKKVLDVDTDLLWDQIQTVKSEYSSKFVSFTPDLKTKHDLEIYYREPEKFVGGWNTCKVPWHSAQILANGCVGIATRCYNVDIGDITTQSFTEIWNGEKMQKFRKELKEVGAYPSCSRCCGVF